ncbi:hypothetical protein [Henriciella litoralis]|uniref:hypothetical protein n=1 Tax=Henriciella litoralis TaxID=568102 RepID=UPI00111C7D91|nr:hypothetical protein [Henriciella litoralis]
MLRTFLTALFSLTFLTAANAEAQTWNSYKNCIAPTAMGNEPQALLQDPYFFTRSGIILTWYIHGAAPFASANPEAVLPFADCFDPDFVLDCGIPRDAAMAATLRGPNGAAALQPGGALYSYFEAGPPPPAAIKYAGQNIGTCFGDDNVYINLEDDFYVSEFDQEACTNLANEMSIKTNGQGLKIDATKLNQSADPALLRQADWAIMYGMTFFESYNCTFYPKSGEKTVYNYYQSKLANERQAARDAKFAGLNGCEIAYGYVYNGINADYVPAGRVPDEGIGWALDYEKANLNNEECPVMPQALSDWVMKQPLESFQPAPDPYTALRRRTRPTFGNDHAAWTDFAEAWMERYDLVNASNRCQDVKDYVFGTNGDNMSADSAEAAFRRLLYLAEKSPERQVATSAVCAFTPDYVWPKVQQYRARQSADRAAAERQRRINEQRTQQSRDRWAPPAQKNFLWTNAPTTRCYAAGDTKYGSNQVCFTN